MNRILLAIAISCGVLFFFQYASAVNAQAQGSASAQGSVAISGNFGLDTAAIAAGLKNNNTDVTEIIGNVIGTGLSLISVLFFILMIYGGILWMTARGADEQATKAKETIFAAIIGIIIVMSAYAITNFVFKSISGSTNTSTTGGGGGTQQTLDWCMTGSPGAAGVQCVEGGGGACPGQTYATENECTTALTGGSGGTACTAPSVCLAGQPASDYCDCMTQGINNEYECAIASNCVNTPAECTTPEERENYTQCVVYGEPDCIDQCN